jgi:ribokinase
MPKTTAIKKPLFDMIAIGEAVLDVFLEVDEATVACELKRTECQICFAFGEKIPVRRLTRIPGAGNASNAAVGAKRLGLNSVIYSVIGNDEAGREIRAKWKEEGVSAKYAITDKKRPTSYSSILFREGERTILVYHEPCKYVLPKLSSAAWIYYTSLGVGHEKLEKQLLTYLKAHPETELCFNPGTHQLRRGLASLLPVIKRSTVFAVNKEEAERLLGVTEKTIQHLMHAFIQQGAKIVVITDGHNGSYATDGAESWFQPIFDGEAFERTGAGDSFATAFSTAIATGLTIPEALRWGTANAWSVVQFIGPQKGLLTKAGMKKVLKKFAGTNGKKLNHQAS